MKRGKCKCRQWIAAILIGGFSISFAGASPPLATLSASLPRSDGRVPVHSSMLKSVAYDEPKKILELEFLSGSVYQYLDVPASIHDELMRAESKGRYYNRNIKRHFKSQKITKTLTKNAE